MPKVQTNNFNVTCYINCPLSKMKLQNIIAMVTFHAKILDTINKSKTHDRKCNLSHGIKRLFNCIPVKLRNIFGCVCQKSTIFTRHHLITIQDP